MVSTKWVLRLLIAAVIIGAVGCCWQQGLSFAADVVTIIGLVLAVLSIILIMSDEGLRSKIYNWVKQVFRDWFWALPLFGKRLIKIIVLGPMPDNRVMKFPDGRVFNPNNSVKIEPLSREYGFRLSAKIMDKDDKTFKGIDICDWKGASFGQKGWVLKEVSLEVYPYSYRYANEWKVGVSILESSAPLPDPYQHRLFGPSHMYVELSRHPDVGKQVIIGVFQGKTHDIRFEGIADGGWNKIRVVFPKDEVCVFVNDFLVRRFGGQGEAEALSFAPDSIWLVFWADRETYMEVLFRRVNTYWLKPESTRRYP